MYVSIRDDTLFATGYQDIGQGLRDFCLGGVELKVNRDYSVHALTPVPERIHLFLDRGDDVARLGEQSVNTGFRIAAFLMSNDFNTADIKKELAWIVRIVEVAARLDVPVLRIDAIMQGERDLPQEEREDIFARSVQRILAETEGLSVNLGIENHGFQGNNPNFLDGLLARIGSPRLGLTLDTGNFYWAGHPLSEVYSIIEHFAPITKHTHVKNIRYPEEIRETQREMGYAYGQYVSPIAEGDINHARVVALLKNDGYDRDLCLEDESLGRYDEEGRRANIRAAVEYFRELI